MIADHPVLFRVLLGLLGCALVYVAACRMKHITKATTLARIRWAVVAQLAAGAVLVLAATWRPDWLQLASVAGPAAALAWFAATSHAWRGAQPLSAMRGGSVIRRPVAAVMQAPRWHDTVPAPRQPSSRRTARSG